MKCDCYKCTQLRIDYHLSRDDIEMAIQEIHFHVCPFCGNKRCPKASNHDLACTNSNEPGQPGSIYQKG
jgi:hypothetical protein